MSLKLIDRSPDLSRLRNDGYDIAVVKDSYLLLKGVPYVNAKKEVKFSTLISNLSLANNVTVKPDPHTVYFIGEFPCKADGTPLDNFNHSVWQQPLATDLQPNYRFSARPPDGYTDYYQKMTTYEAMISGPARVIDPKATARTNKVCVPDEAESVFKYCDTASTRAGIYAITEKLEIAKIAIIGLGGTGSYVLDFISKTPVKEIHLFDCDKFLQHNAFRAPGAASGQELDEQIPKTIYLERIYSKMRRGIISHPEHITPDNVHLLRDMNFVFLCVDNGSAKKFIVEKLEEFGLSFVDSGMGVVNSSGSLCGILRVSTSTQAQRTSARAQLCFADDAANNEYNQNIQIAELNALNAALAVIKWKKLLGYYVDMDKEHFCAYTISGNAMDNKDEG
jgi:ThiF family